MEDNNDINGNLDLYYFSSTYLSTNYHICQALCRDKTLDPLDKFIIIPMRIAGMDGNAFIDCGCTFTAVSSDFASRCGLEIKYFPNDIVCAVGGGSSINIPRRVSKCSFDLLELGEYESTIFIMDSIPLQCDAILGTDFLTTVNPYIDWRNKSARRVVDKEDDECKDQQQLKMDDERYSELMLYHQEFDCVTASGRTTVIRQGEYLRELAEGHTTSSEFFFIVNPVDDLDTAKVRRFKDQGWEALENNPAYEVLLKYKASVFRDKLEIENVVSNNTVTHRIDLVDEIPITVKQFRLSPEQQQAVIAWTKEMLDAGLIRPSTSPYSSPIFCVKKPVGWRIVHDYRLVNSKTRIPQEPIPRKDDIIDAMYGGYWFSCMDLLSGYYQLLLDEHSRKFTAFSTPKGHFEYMVIAQGLAGAPATFNRFVQQVFADLSDISRAFFDDIYVYTRSRDIDAHLGALDRVLGKCEEFGLSIKISKCVFVSPEIPVLGDFVGRSGVRMDPDKVAIIRTWPIPRTKTELKSFLGTIQYCARFCKDYGRLVAPLHHATIGKGKHEAISFTESLTQCFLDLKTAMSSTPTLALPDFTRPFGIRMDASDFAIGGVLFQVDRTNQEHPIAFTGRKMSRAELLYPVREKELLAIVHALKVWRPYLLDRPFVVETDHKTLEELLTQRTCTQRLARWLNLVSEYRPMFRWIPGHTNDTADGLSRRSDFCPEDGPASSVSMRNLLQSILATETPTEAGNEDASPSIQFAHCDQALMVFQLLSSRDIAQLCQTNYQIDRSFCLIWKFLLRGGQDGAIPPKNAEDYVLANNLLWKKAKDGALRLCVPDNDELRQKVLFSEHDDPARGHPGVFKTTHFIKKKYFWPGMTADSKQYVSTCEKCQRNKHRQTKPPGLLNVLPIPEARWQDVTMDFITGLPNSNGNNSIWIIVDRLTKRAHFIPVNMGDSESSAKNCAKVFQKEFQRLHGIPETIISDRDVRFTSTFWRSFMELQGSFHQLSSAFRPNTDGQTERTNRFLEDYVRNYVHASQNNWADLLWSAEIAYNSRIHDSIGMSPFEADLGYVPRSVPDHIFDNIVGTKSKKDILLLGQKQQELLEILKETLGKAQERMKYYYDRNRPLQNFEVGDKVLISSKNLKIEHLGIAKEGSLKFGPLWIGPYPVIQKTTPDTYRLKLPIGLRLHPEFHTSLLKPYLIDPDTERFNKPNEGMLSAGNSVDQAFLIECIVGHKKVKGKILYLVKWVGYPSSENSWEPLSNIRKPASRLIDEYLAVKGLDKVRWNPAIRNSKE